MKISVLAGLSGCVLAAGLARTAQAAPLECSGPLSRVYNNGSSLWQNELETTWSDDFDQDCGRVQRFLDNNTLPSPSRSDFETQRGYCQYMGMFDAGERFLTRLGNQCFHSCRKDGSTLGQIFGENVCSASRARLYAPSMDICTVGEVTGCKNALFRTVSRECSSELNGAKYQRAVENCERLGDRIASFQEPGEE
jgi:hypothetical protein